MSPIKIARTVQNHRTPTQSGQKEARLFSFLYFISLLPTKTLGKETLKKHWNYPYRGNDRCRYKEYFRGLGFACEYGIFAKGHANCFRPVKFKVGLKEQKNSPKKNQQQLRTRLIQKKKEHLVEYSVAESV